MLSFTKRGSKKDLRPYSIASAPGENNSIDLCIIRPKSDASAKFIDDLKVGDSIPISAPAGKFPQPSQDKDSVFIAGGSGIAPLRAMIQDRLTKKVTGKTLLIYGIDDGNFIPYKREFDLAEKAFEKFQVVYCVADISTAQGGMLKGLPTKALKTCLDHQSQYILCGPPALLESSRSILEHHGVSEENILVDRY
jgi:ferredoxin-NADP reductase